MPNTVIERGIPSTGDLSDAPRRFSVKPHVGSAAPPRSQHRKTT
jgi:hypothetical protein